MGKTFGSSTSTIVQGHNVQSGVCIGLSLVVSCMLHFSTREEKKATNN